MLILPILRELCQNKSSEIDAWFEEKFYQTQPFVYNSVDLRHAGFKIAPVDTNIFPAGFNNLTADDLGRARQQFQLYLERYYPKTKRILLLIENHTRNLAYLDNVAALQKILQDIGYEIELANLLETTENNILTSSSGTVLNVNAITKKDSRLYTNQGFDPDLILINNDLTTGIPEILENITQPMIPPVTLGWFQRRKTLHFATYSMLAEQFCQRFGIDSWCLTTFFHSCDAVNFKEKDGLESLADGVEIVINSTRKKYREYGIDEEPYVFIKSDMGTYGMGIMTARSGQEVLSINKDTRKKMNIIKGGTTNSAVIIQEGIPTIDKINGATAEPMLYLVGGKAVGCLYRIHDTRDAYDNLNSSGMHFSSIMHEPQTTPCKALALIARLASYAAAWECYELSFNI